jgi:hypothetical protein
MLFKRLTLSVYKFYRCPWISTAAYSTKLVYGYQCGLKTEEEVLYIVLDALINVSLVYASMNIVYNLL